MDEIETPDDVTGINHARALLGVDRGASDDGIDAAFEQFAASADDQRYWAAVKAREVVLLESVPDGTVVYTILRTRPTPADLAALADATELLACAPPPTDRRSRSSYDRGLRRTLETVRDRLEALASSTDPDVSDENVRAIEVAYHALRLDDLSAGKRWVLGPEAEAGSGSESDPEPDQDGLVQGWTYSVTADGGTEYYAAPDGNTLLRITTANAPDGPETSCEAVRRRGGEIVDTRTGRYGELKRLVKQWILEDAC